MTVKADLEKSIAMAEASKGNYLLFATESEDQKAKQVFDDMAQDMDRHVQILESRRDYLNQHNKLNGGSSGNDSSGSDDSSGGSGQQGQWSGASSGNNKKKQQSQGQGQSSS